MSVDCSRHSSTAVNLPSSGVIIARQNSLGRSAAFKILVGVCLSHTGWSLSHETLDGRYLCAQNKHRSARTAVSEPSSPGR